MKIALIDGDPLFYIIDHHLSKEIELNPLIGPSDKVEFIRDKYDSLIAYIVMSANCSHCRVAFTSPTLLFRDTIYSLAPYKGGRPEKGLQLQTVEDLVRTCHKYSDYCVSGLEADDLLSLWAQDCTFKGIEHVVCSPDKDMKQIPGQHFNYSKNLSFNISEDEAEQFRNMQLLMGDPGDNVLGIPGMGEVKSRAYLRDNQDDPLKAIRQRYILHFGQRYGLQFFEETLHTITMLTTNHKYFGRYVQELADDFEETHVMEVDSGIPNPFL